MLGLLVLSVNLSEERGRGEQTPLSALLWPFISVLIYFLLVNFFLNIILRFTVHYNAHSLQLSALFHRGSPFLSYLMFIKMQFALKEHEERCACFCVYLLFGSVR